MQGHKVRLLPSTVLQESSASPTATQKYKRLKTNLLHKPNSLLTILSIYMLLKRFKKKATKKVPTLCTKFHEPRKCITSFLSFLQLLQTQLPQMGNDNELKPSFFIIKFYILKQEETHTWSGQLIKIHLLNPIKDCQIKKGAWMIKFKQMTNHNSLLVFWISSIELQFHFSLHFLRIQTEHK